MKNTGVVYPSTEKTPVVLPEMEKLLPPLSDEQLAMLEADILTNGCYCPVIVNEDLVVIDGHHRQKLCAEHGIPYQLLVFSFADMLEAKQWALDTQKNRRNLTVWELGNIALKLKPDIEARAQANHAANGGDKVSEDARAALVNSPKPALARSIPERKWQMPVGIGEQTWAGSIKSTPTVRML